MNDRSPITKRHHQLIYLLLASSHQPQLTTHPQIDWNKVASHPLLEGETTIPERIPAAITITLVALNFHPSGRGGRMAFLTLALGLETFRNGFFLRGSFFGG